MSAAYYLSDMGYSKDPRKAIWHYNHAEWYIDEVLNFAAQFKSESTVSNIGNGDVVSVGNRWIGHSVYVFGGGRNHTDINNGKFDCSSFVHWAFQQIGKDLGPLNSVSTDTLKSLGKDVPLDQIEPGDIGFFDTFKKDGHVGIYTGDGKFIGAQVQQG